MNLKRWLSVILMLGLILAFNPLGTQAGPCRSYHHPPGNAYGWDDQGPHGFARHYKHYKHYKQFRRSCKGPHNPHYLSRVYGGPPPVAYVAPVAPVIGIPYAQPQPYFSQPAPRGLTGNLNFGF